MKFSVFVFIFLLKLPLGAQFGLQIQSSYHIFPESNLEELSKPANAMSYSLGPSYWFRLKLKRIEFNPAITFGLIDTRYANNNLDYKERIISFSLPILIYPLDFNNDCNCPTFNKQGQFFEKGFHFILLTELPFIQKQINGNETNIEKSKLSYNLGIGAGIDIGLSKKWTISPAIVLSRYFSDEFTFNPQTKNWMNDDDYRYKLNFMLRLNWFSKRKRY